MKPRTACCPAPTEPEPGPAPGGAFFPLPMQDDLPLRRREWPFYLDRRQRARLRWLHEAWGDDAVIQIYSGCVRIRGECGDWRFSDDAQLRTETARRRGYAVLQGTVRAATHDARQTPTGRPGPARGTAGPQHTTRT
ncbi:hypothetical protein [Paraburkholderia kururiensis]|uniref:hypothetical protein n=1 Tax=Paraburkholderia kururiensis TaxID=984307 RepID=UPI000F8957F7|nr:hypothetical protein [Paraburkholderia kururiensis]